MSEPFLPNSFSLILSPSPLYPIIGPSSGEDISSLMSPNPFPGAGTISPFPEKSEIAQYSLTDLGHGACLHADHAHPKA
jgi:hypothetical protein